MIDRSCAAAQSLISQSHECTQFCVQEEQCLGEYHPLATVVEKAIAACLQGTYRSVDVVACHSR